MVVCFILNCNIVSAGECTKDEIMKMINAGYSKAEVDSTCNKQLKDPMCCCSEDYYSTAGHIFKTRKNAEFERTDYAWKKADNCKTRQTSTHAPDYYIEARCSSAGRCGR